MKNDVSSFVCKDGNTIYVLHLFVYPHEESPEIFKSIIDGYGNFYIPNLEIDKPVKDHRLRNQGKLLAVFDGVVNEKEVRIKLASTGFIEDSDNIVIFPCDRKGIEFSAVLPMDFCKKCVCLNCSCNGDKHNGSNCESFKDIGENNEVS